MRVTKWPWIPGLGWERILRTGDATELEAASAIRLNLEDDPALVPLETLPGKDHYDLPGGDEPPWRWRIPSRPAT